MIDRTVTAGRRAAGGFRSARRIRAAVAVLAVAVLTTFAGLFVPTAAVAAPGGGPTPVPSAPPSQVPQFSTDGIHWSDTYNTQLFQSARLVPNSSIMRWFYVRNSATEDALLTVTLAQVSTNSIPLADAMSISTATAGTLGPTVPISSASPCLTLLHGVQLGSGESTRLNTTMFLGDLNGTIGQAASVSFSLEISLSSTDAGAPTPDACPADFGTVDTFPSPVIDPPTTAPLSVPADAGAPAGASSPIYFRTSSGWRVDASISAVPAGTPPTPLDAAPTQKLVANTFRLYQEDVIAVWLVMAVLGAVLLVVVRRLQARIHPNPHVKPIGTTSR